MSELNCESVCMAVMAMADGYRCALSSDQIRAHLEHCRDCREEVAKLQGLSRLLDSQERRQQVANTWTSIEARLPAPPTRSASAHRLPLATLGGLLLAYRLIEMLPDRNLDWLFRLLPVILVVVAFGYLKENPFKVNPELRFEGE